MTDEIAGRVEPWEHGKPHCKICDHKHWAREPHVLSVEASKEIRYGGARAVGKQDAQRALGIAQSESKSEGARRRGAQHAPGGSVDPVRDDTAQAPQRTPRPTEATGRETGSAGHLPAGGSSGGGCSPTPNTQREGRDVLKGAKPTSSLPTGKPNPPTPPGDSGNQTKAAKATPGKRKTAPKRKKKKK